MKQYSSMPAKLYVKGRLPDPKRRTVAVIGARMCSPYGRMQAFRYAKALSVAGVQIISGMAFKIHLRFYYIALINLTHLQMKRQKAYKIQLQY